VFIREIRGYFFSVFKGVYPVTKPRLVRPIETAMKKFSSHKMKSGS
jgi:hypothetical protein